MSFTNFAVRAKCPPTWTLPCLQKLWGLFCEQFAGVSGCEKHLRSRALG